MITEFPVGFFFHRIVCLSLSLSLVLQYRALFQAFTLFAFCFLFPKVCFLIGGARGSDHGVDDVVVGSGAYDRGGRRKRELRGVLFLEFFTCIDG